MPRFSAVVVASTALRLSLAEHPAEPEPSNQLKLLAAQLRNDPGYMPQYGALFGADVPECHLSTSEECALSGLDVGKPYKLFPGAGSGTACLDPDKPYFFEVRRGDPKKLLFQFQGGGACWDHLTLRTLQVCSTEPYHPTWEGIYDNTNDNNPYKDWSVVYALYCSGDMFAGDAERHWGKWWGKVQVRGYNNGNAALQWALKNFPELEQLSVGGWSAGSLGTQIWADMVLKSFADRKAEAVVLADSFAGVLWPLNIQQKAEDSLQTKWNMCNTPLLEAEEQVLCREGKFLLSDKFVATMRKFPAVRFGMISSKIDEIQIDFEKMLALTLLDVSGVLMSDWEFYEDLNLLLQRYVEEPNFVAYLVDGQAHTFTELPRVYTTTPLGPNTAGQAGRRLSTAPVLIDWISALHTADAFDKVVCKGEPVAVVKDAPDLKDAGVTYCDTNLQGKSLARHAAFGIGGVYDLKYTGESPVDGVSDTCFPLVRAFIDEEAREESDYKCQGCHGCAAQCRKDFWTDIAVAMRADPEKAALLTECEQHFPDESRGACISAVRPDPAAAVELPAELRSHPSATRYNAAWWAWVRPSLIMQQKATLAACSKALAPTPWLPYQCFPEVVTPPKTFIKLDQYIKDEFPLSSSLVAKARICRDMFPDNTAQCGLLVWNRYFGDTTIGRACSSGECFAPLVKSALQSNTVAKGLFDKCTAAFPTNGVPSSSCLAAIHAKAPSATPCPDDKPNAKICNLEADLSRLFTVFSADDIRATLEACAPSEECDP
mmetsp:Transcript_30819/g.89600  ORF Transcript_30819/g.89600 Transcript_30819/m.89600 type:complete len:772 (+) Transcript_30819:68-2383(+)